MPGSEQISSLKEVRGAKKEVEAALCDPDLEGEERKPFEAAYSQLDKVEGILLLSYLNDRAEELETRGQKLGEVTRQMSTSIAGLETEVTRINKAAGLVTQLAGRLSGG